MRDAAAKRSGYLHGMRSPVSVCVALLCVMVACGPPSAAPTATAPRATASATTTPPPKAGLGLEPLRAGTSGDYPPLSIWKDGRVEGFAPALVVAFASAQKMELRWTRFGWPGLSEDLRAGRFDLAADGITVRPERSIGGRFSVPIARGGAVLLVRRPSSASSTRRCRACGWAAREPRAPDRPRSSRPPRGRQQGRSSRTSRASSCSMPRTSGPSPTTTRCALRSRAARPTLR